LPAFDHAAEASPLFVDSVVGAVGVHVARTYGALKVRPRAARGGLAPWQERRAKELLSSNLGGDLTIATIAKACGLSSSQFSRCFRQTTGLAPHQWLLHRRVEVAKDLLPRSGTSLSEIGLACGFADQSHFTRVFTRIVGVSPGAWRRSFCLRPQALERQVAAG
jgi:AraC family transcriptional regulator